MQEKTRVQNSNPDRNDYFTGNACTCDRALESGRAKGQSYLMCVTALTREATSHPGQQW